MRKNRDGLGRGRGEKPTVRNVLNVVFKRISRNMYFNYIKTHISIAVPCR